MVVDKFSRFLFAGPCKDTSTETVKKCLLHLFSLFGAAKYMHSDRGNSLISQESHNHLLSCNVASSQSTPYNPGGSRQVEH